MATKEKKIGGKRYDAIRKQVERLKLYSVEEAIDLAKKNATCKFDETIEVTINLNILPKHSIRDTLSFPNAFGKEKRVVVFAQGEKADEAKAAGAMEVGFEDLIDKIPVKANKAIVDPPRSGLHKKVRDVFLSRDFETIIYISCNPKTLVSDLKELTKKYKIEKLTAYDMFPYTKHVECVCLLNLR